jgi:two-component system, cell cycle response regulator
MKTILVADDNMANRELICAILERRGYRVLNAADGQDALQFLQSESPDMILLDIHMPRLDGYGLLERLRQVPRLAGRPMVAVTASAMAGDEERALAAGFTAYLAKPYEVDDVVGLVDRLLNNE